MFKKNITKVLTFFKNVQKEHYKNEKYKLRN